MKRQARLIASTLFGLIGCSGENLVLDDPPGLDPELTERLTSSADPPGDWSCLDPARSSSDRTMPERSLPERVTYRLPIVDFETGAESSELSLLACGIVDARCSLPVGAEVTIADGGYEITLPGGFDGYLKITGPRHVTTSYFFDGPRRGGPARERPRRRHAHRASSAASPRGRAERHRARAVHGAPWALIA